MSTAEQHPAQQHDPAQPHGALTWSVVAEGDLGLQDHEAIAAMLALAFPSENHWFTGGRSWAGMQPERRVLARIDDVVVAHLGIRRQFVEVGGQDLLVGGVGLVSVTPRLQSAGVGRELLRRTAVELEDLRVPFGLLGTGEDRVPFYRANGWQLLEDTVGYFTALSTEGAGLNEVDDEGWLVLPVTAALEEWPGGELRFNGQFV